MRRSITTTSGLVRAASRTAGPGSDLTHHPDAVDRLEQDGEAATHDGVIIGEHHPDERCVRIHGAIIARFPGSALGS